MWNFTLLSIFINMKIVCKTKNNQWICVWMEGAKLNPVCKPRPPFFWSFWFLLKFGRQKVRSIEITAWEYKLFIFSWILRKEKIIGQRHLVQVKWSWHIARPTYRLSYSDHPQVCVDMNEKWKLRLEINDGYISW